MKGRPLLLAAVGGAATSLLLWGLDLHTLRALQFAGVSDTAGGPILACLTHQGGGCRPC